MSMSIGPECETVAAAKTDVKDNEVPVPTGTTACFGGTFPEIKAKYHEGFIIPSDYSEVHGPAAFYRVPGVAFGVSVARRENRIMIRCSWPNSNWLISVEEKDAEPIIPMRCVRTIKVPKGWKKTGLPSFVKLPGTTRVKMVDKSIHRLADLPGGLQQNINLCYK